MPNDMEKIRQIVQSKILRMIIGFIFTPSDYWIFLHIRDNPDDPSLFLITDVLLTTKTINLRFTDGRNASLEIGGINRRIVDQEKGIFIDQHEFTADTFYQTIRELLKFG